MGRRHYKRHRIALPVTVSGRDGSGHPFRHSATTVEIGANGLRLRGLRGAQARGDPVEVEYMGRSARCRVAWMGAPGTCWEGTLGLEAVDDVAALFAGQLPQALLSADPEAVSLAVLADHGAVERRQDERRRYPRFNCAGTASIWEAGCEPAVSGRCNEISRGGCYIEMMSPLRLGTMMRLELEVQGRTIRAEAVVRTSHPTMGMGVEFTRLGLAEADKLHGLIVALSGNVEAPLASPARPPLLAATPDGLGESVLRWFGSHESLSRQEFLELLQHSEREPQGLTRA